MSFREYAIDSANVYYNFLKDKNRGIIEYKVLGISPIKYEEEEGYFELRLDRKIAMPEFVQVQIDERIFDSASVQIVSFTEKENLLTVKPVADLWKLFSEINYYRIKIFSDLKFLVKRVESWYKEYGDKISIPVKKPILAVSNLKNKEPKLADSQIKAIEGILSTPFSYVWGAPGTGKTQIVLANVITEYVLQNKKVLLVAPTNNAVEQSLRGVLPVLKRYGIDLHENVIRLGVTSDRFSKEYPEVCENSRIARTMQKLQDRKRELKDKIDENEKAVEQIVLYEQRNDVIKELNNAAGKLIKLHDVFNSQRPIIISKEQEQDRLEKHITELVDDKKSAEIEKNRIIIALGGLNVARDKYSSGIRALFSKQKLEETNLQIQQMQERGGRLEAEINRLDNNIIKLRSEIVDIEADIKEKVDEFNKSLNNAVSDVLEKDVQKNMSDLRYSNFSDKYNEVLSQIRTTIAALKEENSTVDIFISQEELRIQNEKLEAEISEIEKEYENISHNSDEKFENCLLIAATIDTSIARISPEAKNDFAHVFLDEAGFCNTIKAATLLAYDCPVTFLGDHMQLPPVCEMNDKDISDQCDNWGVSYWAQSALFVENVLYCTTEDFKEEYIEGYGPSFNRMKKYSLTKSFRFGTKLANILASTVYDDSFIGNENCDTNLYFINAHKAVGDERRSSTGERQAIIAYCKDHKDEEIAVLTPYKAQVESLKRDFANNGLNPEIIFTIHKSQGREWDTVLFSVADTSDMYFVNSFNSAARGKNLINTAVSRAKKKLIIVADYNYWINQKGQMIERLLSVAEKDDISDNRF